MGVRFPRGHPYVPRRRYTAPTFAATKSKKFMRDIVLLDTDDPDTLPRGARKMALQEEGRVANMVELDSSWDDEHIFSIIEGRFEGIIDLSQPFPR